MGSTTVMGNDRRANRWRPAIWGGAALLLLLPAVAMQFTREVNWTASDFIVMGAMLCAACLAYELGAWMSGNTAYRAGFAVAVANGFLLVWINLAVGFLGGESNADNLAFAGVLLVGLVGALVARFRTRGMVVAMVATAVAGLLVSVFAWVRGYEEKEVLLAALFAMPWLVSAWLFHKAAREQAPA